MQGVSGQDSSVEIVVPVYNEEACLAASIERLRAHLVATCPQPWTITIADNASSDRTPAIAARLARDPRIDFLRLERKGRGFALRTAFLRSRAAIVCYMDVDLSTNLRFFNLLLAGLACGFDIAIGSRLLRAAQVRQRRLYREVLSRGYNLLIKGLFWTGFSDAQCGFKGLRTEVARRLLPEVENENWFFDTELLLLAEHHGFRIFELPVEWTDDLDSRVNVLPTVLEDLQGLLRMRLRLGAPRLLRPTPRRAAPADA